MRHSLHWDRETLRTIFTLALPTMIEQFMQTCVQYIDTAMVGTLGTAATAAVGATSTVNWLVGSTVSAFGVGFLALISQACGAGDEHKARTCAAQAFTVTGCIGLLMTCITLLLSHKIPIWMQTDPGIRQTAESYFRILYMPMLFRTSTIILGMVLRSAGDTRSPMRIGFLVNGINVVLNFFMIYPTRNLAWLFNWQVPGMGLGVEGAAWASSIAYTVGGIAIAWKVWRHPAVSPKGFPLSPDKSILLPCMRISFPNMFQRFGTSLGYVVFAALINSLGGTATAAHTIANTVESAFYIPGWGMQTAAATLAGNAYGANDREGLKKLSYTFLVLEVVLMLVSGSLLFLLARPLVGLFSSDPQVIRLGTTVLRMVAVSEPFYGIPIIVEGMMQGQGSTRIPLIYNLCGMWFVRILGTYVMLQVAGYGLEAAWGCMIAHNLLLFILFGRVYLSGRWIRLSGE
ncbi:MAG: MATE family efflux transporter [Clostridia bacterium]|nr:MATE family efflux transporter [Clostridia bacterium]